MPEHLTAPLPPLLGAHDDDGAVNASLPTTSSPQGPQQQQQASGLRLLSPFLGKSLTVGLAPMTIPSWDSHLAPICSKLVTKAQGLQNTMYLQAWSALKKKQTDNFGTTPAIKLLSY
ncbi:uncharacterized protein MAM_03277 [Metarhizium album ARSEF 1941]|uniref:Uncharacterized protein n=1 Tax=Metarhizium album (strain ARSEF 1941) TaxID=1081103 RepID=A0A0B2X176_METAS|nr:uncharacterized protein MAM_03277 [Metarhizium album ARSEF 1941]KHN98815.1 hypothetical protein MAM_03277 [Metarhizium album ARSEF 1941]